MSAFLRLTSHFLIAAIATFILASLSHSQFVLHELGALGVEIDFATRISSSLDDLIGLMPGYGAVVAVSLLVGFSIMALLRKFFPKLGYWAFPIAGFLAMLAAHIAMHPLLNITLIAGARSTFGLFCQCLAGLFGGWAFMNMRQPKN